MNLDKFEKAFCIIILSLAIFAAVSQITIKKEHNEMQLKRKIQYQQFLEQKDHHAVFADYRVTKEKPCR